MLLSLLAKARQKKDADDDVTVFLQRIDGFLDFTSKELKVASLTIEGMPRG